MKLKPFPEPIPMPDPEPIVVEPTLISSEVVQQNGLYSIVKYWSDGTITKTNYN